MRSIQLMKFSFGGHLLAVSQGKFIHIISLRTLQKVTTLQGHSRDVTHMSFDPEAQKGLEWKSKWQDHTLWSAGEEGKLIVWNLHTFEIEATRTAAGRDERPF